MALLTALFQKRPAEALLVSYKETNDETKETVGKVCRIAGLVSPIAAVFQPARSAEINSQNYIVHFSTGEKLLLRRCQKFQGRERYESLYTLMRTLREHGVRVPEFYSAISDGKVPYFETEDKACWVFFKYIEAEKYFSGTTEELEKAAEQVGKLHTCLKAHYGKKVAIPANEGTISAPALSKSAWERYLPRISEGKDEYDRLFLESRAMIEEMMQFVEEHFALLQEDEVQNIHFDLNSANFLVTQEQDVTLMDFDEVKLGNVYTDIGFAFHRLLTTCMEQRELEEEAVGPLIQTFFASYGKGNPSLILDLKKMGVATFNRALRNVQNDLFLRYDQASKVWQSSIAINLKRLKQVQFLIGFLKEENGSSI